MEEILEQALLNNRLLEAKILAYRIILSNLHLDTLDNALVLNTYDKHFGIISHREGKI